MLRGAARLAPWLLLIACVDPLDFEINLPAVFPVTISGFISDNAESHRVTISKAFDIESRIPTRDPILNCKVYLEDGQSSRKLFAEIAPGVYEVTGVQGSIGVAYTLTAELPDGRVYQSLPDILPPPGKMDSLYFNFHFNKNGFEIFFDATLPAEQQQFLWALRGTFKATTRPQFETGNCYRTERGVCNYRDPCSGIKNVGTDYNFNLVQVEPCTCCTCWYDFFNQKVLLSDFIFPPKGKFTGTRIYDLALNGWVLMERVRIEVAMRSLSPQAFRFWKAIQNQQEAVNSLFQPLGGQIPSNFVQKKGAAAPVFGLFYATSISTKVMYINRWDVPYEELIPPVDDPKLGAFSCLKLFPHATTSKPTFWE